MSRPEYPRSILNFWPHYRPTFKKRFWLSKGLSNRDKLLKPTLRPQLILVNSCKPCQVKFPAFVLNFRLFFPLNVLTKKWGGFFCLRYTNFRFRFQNPSNRQSQLTWNCQIKISRLYFEIQVLSLERFDKKKWGRFFFCCLFH